MTRIIAWLLRVAEHLPPWLRPAFWGAAVLFGVVGFRMLFAVPFLLRQPAKLREFGLGLLAAMAAGAVGGLSYTFVGKPLLRVRVVGPYLAGVAMVGGYMLALAIALPFVAPGEPLMPNAASKVIFAVVTVGFGLVVGFQLRDHPKATIT